MDTLILSTTEYSDGEIIEKAGEILRNGGLVAFPTETVYGLGGNALNPEASKKIYAAKGRPSDNPLIVHIGKKEDLYPLVNSVSEKAERLMDAFWPGPLTIILPKSELVPKETTGGLDTVAIRFPVHPFAKKMLENVGVPVAAPSANLSGRPSTTRASHVTEDLDGRVDMIIDGGDVPIGVESTIIDMTGEIPMLLRPGYVTKAQMEEVIGEIRVDPAITNENIISHSVALARPKAPGMKYRHYAPKGDVTVVWGEENDVIRAIAKKADEETGILCVAEHKGYYQTGKVVVCGSKKSPDSIAHELFDALRTFDRLGVTKIYAEDFTRYDIGTAIMNRLLKAAGGTFRKADEI